MRRVILALMILMATSGYGDNLPDFDSKWDYDKPAETEKLFREMLLQVKASGNASYLAELQTQIARTLGLQMKFAEAHALLDTVENALDKISDTAKVRYLLERGRVYNSSQMQEKALPLFREAYELGIKAWVDNYVVDAAHMIAIASSGDERAKWNDIAIQFAEKSDDPKARKWLASLYNNKGWTFFEEKQYDSALVSFEKAYTNRLQLGQFRQMQIARWCIAKTKRMLGNYQDALSIQRQLEKEFERTHSEPDGYVFEEIGECLLAMGNAAEAHPYFAKAYAILSKDPWLTRDEPERLQRMKELGQVE